MKNHLLFLGILFSIVNIFGQELPKIIPPSPEAYKFSTYGNIPLNGSTGGFSYSVPLFDLSEGDIKIQTSINYFSNGVHIDAMSSIIGMSWNLNAGGVVSRVVRGMPDEQSDRWYPETISSETLDHEDYQQIKNSAGEDPSLDTQPDWFSFNVNGISGNFYFDENLEIKVNTNNHTKIVFNRNGGNSEFVITDEKGYKYFFGGTAEFTETNYYTDCQELATSIYKSSWFLSKIVSPNSNEVNFSYQAVNYYYSPAISNSVTFSEDCICPRSIGRSFSQNHNKCVYYSHMFTQVLKEISSTNGKIQFNYIENNSNVITGKNLLLDEVILFSKNQSIEKFKLIYDTVNAIDNHSDSELDYMSSLKTRYYLKSITNKNFNDLKDNTYLFDYYNKEALPCRLSYNKDIFGYYNDTNNAKPFSYPKEDKAYLLAQRMPSLFGVDNKEVNPTKVHYGMLKKITYPTGGTTLVTYEANSDIGLFPEGSTIHNEIVLSKNCLDAGYSTEGSYTFISNGEAINYQVSAIISDLCDEEFEENFFDVTIKNITTGETIRSFTINDINDTVSTSSTDPLLECIYGDNTNFSNAYNMQFPLCTISGNEYEIKFLLYSKFNSINGKIKFDYNKSTQLVEKTYYGGGARVKSIVDKSENNEYNKREFYYNKLEEYPSDHTTLNKVLDPKYSNKSNAPTNCIFACCGRMPIPSQANGIYGQCKISVISQNENNNKSKYYISSNSLVSFYNNRKQSVYYTAITEFIGDGVLKTGAIEKKYKDITDLVPEIIAGSEIFNVPYSNISDVSYGRTDEINYYKYDANNYIKIKKENYVYNRVENIAIPATVIQKNYSFDEDLPIGLRDVSNYSITQYHNYIAKKRLSSKIETTYFPEVLTNELQFEYNGAPYYNLRKKTSTTSVGEIMSTKTYYPQDKNQLTNLTTENSIAIDSLVAQHRIAIPIQVETKKNNILTSKVRSNFKDWGVNELGTNNIIQPTIVESSKGIGALKQVIVYHKYNSKGKPLEVSKADGMRICYIWGYNKTQPIAKIENATYTQITAYVSNLQTLSNADNDRTTDVNSGTNTSYQGNEGALRQALNNLRTVLPNAMVTTFTYDPLIGLTSVTDPKGEIQYYTYDTFNRLQYVKDKEGKVLKENEYHYRNQ